MEEKCAKKLKEWFGNLKFDYIPVHCTDGECIFVTISESGTKEERTIEMYRVFKLGDRLEISQDLEYAVNLEEDSSILTCIGKILKAYGRL